MWIRRFGIVGAVAGLVALVGCDPAGQAGKTSGTDETPDGSGSAKVAEGPDAGGAAADPLPTAPFEPAEAPEPTERLDKAPSADELSGMIESYFQDRPGRRIYIQTDKPLYRPGETIWVKSWNLLARDLTGVSDNRGVVYRLISPKGDTVEKKRVREKGGHASIDFEVGDEMKGGRYTLKAQTLDGHSAERPVVISNYEAPRIKKELEFVRKAYGEGDEVVASVELKRGTGQPLADRAISADVRVDGRQLEKVEATTNAQGAAALRFELPDEIERGDGILTVLVTDAGVTESISRRIPIVLDKLDLEFFPEAGQIVGGLPTRVYFSAKKPNGKPADVAGYIETADDERVAEFRSYKNGMGRFEFTPEEGEEYRAVVTKPEGVEQVTSLPDPDDEGCVLRHFDDPEGRLAATRVAIRCTEARKVVVSGFMRNNPLDTAAVEVPADGEPAVVYLEPDNEALANWQGVARVTLFDDKLEPMAERLVYRRFEKRLEIEVEPKREDYGPRDEVELTVRTKNPSGDLTPGRVAMSVVDDKVISFADDKTGHLLSKLLLEPELPGDIEEPNFYLNRDKPKAARALDMLMGTRGYREFKWQKVVGDRGADSEEEAAAPSPDEAGPEKREEVLPEQRQHPKGQKELAEGGEKPSRADREVKARRAQPERKKQMRPVGNNRLAKVAPDADQKGVADMIRFEDRAAGEAPAFGGGIRARRGRRGPPRPPRWEKIREFPVPDYSGEQVGARSDFRDTVYWNPDIETGADGEATVSFYLSDAITSFRVFSEGVGSGMPGRDETVFKSVLPFSLTAKLPLQVSAGDHVEVPVTLMNEREEPVDVTVHGSFGELLGVDEETESQTTITVEPGERESHYFGLDVTGQRGQSKVVLTGEAAGLTDEVERTIEVSPRGFPRTKAKSGEVGESVTEVLDVEGALEGTHEAEVKVFPNPISSMTEGLEGMLRMPTGCFEQASSSNYPNVMLMRYLEEQGAAAPQVASRAKRMMDRGYKKLTGYETSSEGYEWFGKAPGHEALTAYGLLQFVHMKDVWPEVDQGMIDRTAAWLMSRRDGEGGYKQNPKALDSFGRASDAVTHAYITYSLTEAGYTDKLGTEIDAQAEAAKSTDDPYVLALATNTLLNAGRSGAAKSAIDRLLGMQAESGAWTGADHSITRSRGRNLQIETTALAVMALMEAEGHRSAVRSGVKYLNGNRGALGGWGATQATVLTLRALTTYTDMRNAERGPGSIRLVVNGETVAEKSYTSERSEPLVFDFSDRVIDRKNKVEIIRTEGAGTPVPYTVGIRYRTEKPATDPDARVSLKTELAKTKLSMGQTVRLTATAENTTDEGLGMALARVGLPGGLTFQQWQLKELQEEGKVGFIETRKREVILYFRDMKPGETKEIPLELKAFVPGTFTGQASRSYLYYNNDKKHWTEPLSVEVAR